MKDNITYRAATLEDIPVLLGFEQELIAYERPFDSNLKDHYLLRFRLFNNIS